MNVSGESRAWANRNESVLILLLCVAAAIRVLIFSAAFPFFSNIDEDLHFDLVTQYSHARLPQSFARLQEETLNWIVPYASPEFLFTADRFPEGKFPSPIWKQSWSQIEPEIAVTRAAWSSEVKDRKSTRLNSSHITSSYAVFCLKKKNNTAFDRLM